MNKKTDITVDGMNDLFSKIILWLEHFRLERSQLYGVAINLMIELGKNDTSIPLSDMEFASEYRLDMIPDMESKTLKLHLEKIK